MNKNIAGRMIKRIHDEKMPDPKMINHEMTKTRKEAKKISFGMDSIIVFI